uniref:Apyrase 6 n=1 Tax=Nelumbo nucifera TaxID=4432 RepID=A0A822YGJ1_NELNU|nr:TPA_asm: hypothetical protein HUJ06_010113 [Nelumbo nucifera]
MRRSNIPTPAVQTQKKMDTVKLHFRPNPPRSNKFFSRISTSNTKCTPRGDLWIFVAVVVSITLFCYLFVNARGSRNSPFSKRKFAIVLDGGSTGTRIHVFRFSINGKGVPLFDFGKDGLASMRVNPGLSSYSANPENAASSLLKLLKFAKERIPKDHWGETEIRLMATAGLRRLDLDIQERILDSCRKVLSDSDFLFRDHWASVITGSDEGLYAWVAANYALGTLGGDPQNTTGIIELGGASAQVTFVSSEPLPPEFSHTLKFGNFTYNLYSHSLLHFGQNVAYDSLQELLASRDWKFSAQSVGETVSIDPCSPKGYSHEVQFQSLPPAVLDEKSKYLPTLHARGNFSECRSAALMLLQKGKEKCPFQHCYIGSTFIPKLQGKFLATENFYHTSKFFRLPETAFLSNLMFTGQQFCEEDRSALKKKYSSLSEDDLLRYCFSSSYIVALLHDTLGISLDDQRILVANQVANMPLDWALGAFILQNTAESGMEVDWIVTNVSDDSSMLVSLFFVFIMVIFTAWSLSKWQKPQYKTIYDLEKGRYIVSCVSR